MKKAGTINFLMALMLIGLASPLFPFDYVVPDTGQDLCYDWDKTFCEQWHMDGPNQVCDSDPYCPNEGEDFYGQDAQYIINPPDLTDNGNGTVTDNLTRLVWLKNSNSFGFGSWYEALAWCSNLEGGYYGLQDNSSIGDWRLPNVLELLSLVDFDYYTEGFRGALPEGHPFTNPTAGYHWTSTTSNSGNNAWVIAMWQMGSDITVGGKSIGRNMVWCVRDLK